jgi:uncharacterized repeat protein (TIGR03803 family)
MSHAPTLNILWPQVLITNRLLYLALACTIALAAVPLRAQTYQDLFDFNCPTGCAPYDYGRLTRGTDGYLYGTTGYGGTTNQGTIFKVTTTGMSYIVLWNFDGTSGYLPLGGLTLASADGNFYGTTAGGGTSNYGTLFRFNPSTSTLTVLHNFTKAESSPAVAPVEAKDFNLYGTAQSGAVYRLTVKTGTYQLLPNPAPNIPNAPLLQASDGYLYGTSQLGGKNNLGTVFRMNTAGTITIVHSFKGSDGAEPVGPLVQGKNGSLYGTTSIEGSVSNAGTVFKLTVPAFKLTTLHAFDGTNGDSPVGGLLAATDGNFYGTTTIGGAVEDGTIFQITPGGVFTKLFEFTGAGGAVSGAFPDTTLTEDTNGVLYGLTSGGGANGVGDGDGVFYSLTLPSVNRNITLCCNWWVILDQPVIILGDNLTEVFSVNFGSVPAQFQLGSDTYLTAHVPSTALDGPITVTLATGEQIESQQGVHILPKITNLDPSSGPVGTQVHIVGGGFAGAKKVTFGGVAATTFTVLTPAMIQATVPFGAITGKVTVTTPNGTATSKEIFTVN